MPVNEPPADAALEEAAAAVAGVDAVVFAAAGVATHFAQQGRTHGFPRRRALGCGFKQSAERGSQAVKGVGGNTVSAGRSCGPGWHCFTCVPAICVVDGRTNILCCNGLVLKIKVCKKNSR